MVVEFQTPVQRIWWCAHLWEVNLEQKISVMQDDFTVDIFYHNPECLRVAMYLLITLEIWVTCQLHLECRSCDWLNMHWQLKLGQVVNIFVNGLPWLRYSYQFTNVIMTKIIKCFPWEIFLFDFVDDLFWYLLVLPQWRHWLPHSLLDNFAESQALVCKLCPSPVKCFFWCDVHTFCIWIWGAHYEIGELRTHSVTSACWSPMKMLWSDFYTALNTWVSVGLNKGNFEL